MSDENLRLMIQDLIEVDSRLKDAEIDKWLPPKTKENIWQHNLVNQLYIRNSRLVIEFNMDVLLEEGDE